MHYAGQKSVASNHRRAADACNAIAWAIKEEEEEEKNPFLSLFNTLLNGFLLELRLLYRTIFDTFDSLKTFFDRAGVGSASE